MKKMKFNGKDTDYKIDEYGNIWSFHIYKEGKLLKPKIDKDGYLKVSITIKKNKTKTVFVHRLVAENFVHNEYPDLNMIVNHLDGNKQNNFYKNLEWTTAKGNTRHAVYYNLFPTGERSTLARFSNNDIEKVCKLIQKQILFSDIEKETGVPVNVINKIYRGDCWKSISRKYIFMRYNHDERLCEWSKFRQEIINYINQGYNRGEIAKLMNISDPSFKTYIKIQRKNLKLKVQRLAERRTLK